MNRVAYRGLSDDPVVEPVRAPTIFATEIASSVVDSSGVLHLLLVNKIIAANGAVERRVALRLQMPVDLGQNSGRSIERAWQRTEAAKRARLM